jgi:hypothetical protein
VERGEVTTLTIDFINKGVKETRASGFSLSYALGNVVYDEGDLWRHIGYIS